MKPVFSVIIPTYNRAHTLTRAIASVRAQSFPHWELLVIDDGSTDGTRELVPGHPQIQLHTRPHGGVSAARNTGIQLARGEWIALLDSDDEWAPTKLARQWEWLQTHSQQVCHTEELWVRRGRRVNPKRRHQKSGGDLFIPSLELCLMSPSSIIIHREVFQRVGLFREDFPVCEDYDLWLKITSLMEVGFLSTPLITKYGGHADQLSTSRPGLDEYRLQSLNWILHNRTLTSERRQAVLSAMKRKAQILAQGYAKRGRQERLHWLYSLLHSSDEFLAAELRPTT